MKKIFCVIALGSLFNFTTLANEYYHGVFKNKSTVIETGVAIKKNASALGDLTKFYVAYKQNKHSKFKLCHTTTQGRSPIKNVKVVFSLGKRSATIPMSVNCVYRTGKGRNHPKLAEVYDGFTPYALMSLSFYSKGHVSKSRLAFERIFPKKRDGSRWYAVKVAIKFPGGHDSNLNKDYSIILDPVNVSPF